MAVDVVGKSWEELCQLWQDQPSDPQNLALFTIAQAIEDKIQSELSDDNFKKLFKTFEFIAENKKELFTIESHWPTSILKVLAKVPDYSTNDGRLQFALPILIKLMNLPGYHVNACISPITMTAITNPGKLKAFAVDLMDLYLNRNMQQLAHAVSSVMPAAADELATPANVEKLASMLKEGNFGTRMTILSSLTAVAKSKPDLLLPYMGDIGACLMDRSLCTQVAEIANAMLVDYYPIFLDMSDKMIEAVQENPVLEFQVAPILGMLGRISPGAGAKMLSTLLSWIGREARADPIILQACFNIIELDKNLATPHLDTFKGFSASLDDSVRQQAKRIVDLYLGLDKDSLSQKVMEMNAKVADAAKDWDAMKKYVDDNINLVKDFVGEVTKKLPIPNGFRTENKFILLKKLILEFSCEVKTEGCLYSQQKFECSTLQWNKWLKVAFAGVRLGVCIYEGDALGGLDAIKGVYDVFKTKYDENFNAFISEPFLTSSEQDNLVKNLKDSKYFDSFSYQARTHSWACSSCAKKGGVAPSDNNNASEPSQTPISPKVETTNKAKAVESKVEEVKEVKESKEEVSSNVVSVGTQTGVRNKTTQGGKFLQKKSKGMKSWVPRFLFVDFTGIYRFRTEADFKALNSKRAKILPWDAVQEIKKVDAGKPFCFEVLKSRPTLSGLWIMQAKDEGELQEWITLLTNFKQQYDNSY